MHKEFIFAGFKEFLAFFDFIGFYVDTSKESHFSSFSKDTSEVLWFNIFFSKVKKEVCISNEVSV